MENHAGSFTGFIITIILGLFAHWTKSDIAIYVTIMAGVTTVIVNIVKLYKNK